MYMSPADRMWRDLGRQDRLFDLVWGNFSAFKCEHVFTALPTGIPDARRMIADAVDDERGHRNGHP